MLSRTISRHHCSITRSMERSPRARRCDVLKWNHMISPEVVSRAAVAPRMGHGLGSTIW